MEHYDLIVVGAGTSGIVLASKVAAAGRRVLLLEREPRVGGCIHSWRPEPDYWVELGAHTAYNSYQALLEVLQARDGLSQLLARESLSYRFYSDRRFTSPLARLSFLELALSLPFGLAHGKRGSDLARYYGALFGRRNYRRLLAPAFAAVLSQPADAFPAEWLFRKKPRMKSAPRKYTWGTGLQGLLEWLVAEAPFETRLDCEVEGIDRNARGYRVELCGEHIECAQLALATSPEVAATLLSDAHAEIAAQLARIPMAEIETTAVVVPADKSDTPKLAGIIGGDEGFYSAVSRDPVPHPQWRGFAFHFQPHRLDRDGRLRRIADVLGVGVEDFVAVMEKVNRLPALGVEHVGLAKLIDQHIVSLPLALAGNYLNGLSIGDCAERAAREAERLIALSIAEPLDGAA
ncbi:MAG: protoporphyrinogen/coproporphyrinogen oxidase [Thiotrichales bacterium]